jgi:formyltetrahydrofolate hydrolase
MGGALNITGATTSEYPLDTCPSRTCGGRCCAARTGLAAAVSTFLADAGADVERVVLSRALLWHCENRII